MPRTKVQRKKPNGYQKQLLPVLKSMKDKMIQRNHDLTAELLEQERMRFEDEKLLIPFNIQCKTVGELIQEDFSSLRTSKLNRPKRSVSVGVDDEGYRTADSTGHSGPEQKRASRTAKRQTQTKVTRASRSLSRTNTGNVGPFKTPANTISLTSFGTVTPKVNPNVPQKILRRPKMGEMALSLQGSPLLVHEDTKANINIPLEDGRVFSIQPRKGLRISQIPNLDSETANQLLALRENLNRVCAGLTNK